MNKELTPMQELINDLQDNEPKYYERNYNYLHNLLEKEKQVNEEFHQIGAIFAYGRKGATREDRLNHFENYYNNKFKKD